MTVKNCIDPYSHGRSYIIPLFCFSGSYNIVARHIRPSVCHFLTLFHHTPLYFCFKLVPIYIATQFMDLMAKLQLVGNIDINTQITHLYLPPEWNRLKMYLSTHHRFASFPIVPYCSAIVRYACLARCSDRLHRSLLLPFPFLLFLLPFLPTQSIIPRIRIRTPETTPESVSY